LRGNSNHSYYAVGLHGPAVAKHNPRPLRVVKLAPLKAKEGIRRLRARPLEVGGAFRVLFRCIRLTTDRAQPGL